VAGPTRVALGALREELSRIPAADRRAVAEDLYAVRDLVASSHALARTLTDQATDATARRNLVGSMFGGKIGDPALRILQTAVTERWSAVRDLADGLEEVGNEAVLGIAEEQGRLDAVEDDLFRFSKILERSPQLSLALSDPSVPDERKADLVGSLLDGKADADAVLLARRAILGTSGVPLERSLTDLVELAADRRMQLVAVVESARPLSAQQSERLAVALKKIYGKNVRIQADIDPTLVGGLTVHVGDEVIDGSVLRRLIEARAALTR
jgi:F-type H+-transporting ATPase subunit delta